MASQDIALVIDNTGSMGDDIAEVKAQASAILDSVFADGGRVAVVTYNDPDTATVLGFTDDAAAAQAAIDSISTFGGGDLPEMVCTGLTRALDLPGWRPDADARKIVLFGDAPPKDGPCDSVISRASATDTNIEVHGVAIGSDEATIEAFTTIAEGTGGQLWNPADASEVVDTLVDVIEEPPAEEDDEEMVGPQDVAFVIDNTGSMGDDIAEVQARALEILDLVLGEGDGQVAVVTYNDFFDDSIPDATVVQEFTTDADVAAEAINGITVSGGGDFPEMVYTGLQTALDLEGWRDDPVSRKIILFGDAPPKDDELRDAVLAAAGEEGINLSIFGVAIGGDPDTVSSFTDISEATGGSLKEAADATEVVDTLVEAIEAPVGDGGVDVGELSEDFVGLSYLMVGTAPTEDSPIVEVASEGGSLRDAASAMLSDGSFLSQFSFSSTLEEKVNVITVNNMGLSSGSEAQLLANAYFMNNLTGGVSANVVFERAVTYLLNDDIRDPLFDDAAGALRGEGVSLFSMEADGDWSGADMMGIVIEVTDDGLMAA